MGVNLNVTAPAPIWATGNAPGRPDIDATYDPSAAEFGAFVRAAAQRYPGVHYWSIWNEPNQAGVADAAVAARSRATRPRWVPTAPRSTARLVDAAWTALQETGHGSDTILVGETAPKGDLDARERDPLDRRPCASSASSTASTTTCSSTGHERRGPRLPDADQVAQLRRRPPRAVRGTSGWAHHPYELTRAARPAPDPTATPG